MIHRFVSFVLVLALLLCPFWCGLGNCQAQACCAIDGQPAESLSANPLASELSAEIDRQAPCCCGESKPSPPESVPPKPSSDDSECQGICGGAVPQKVSDTDELTRCSGPDCVLARTILLREFHGLARFRQSTAEDTDCYRGLSLRTLYMSFIC
ncbi:hypothetical protein KOR42_06440 [Thalassoglobus neptunius]|uniref:Uncharacterized protein n=1 Tax=Thalassoglobus neptunius TaxID=1938619 RepID=A0A5C5X502_9PLAN|nr:hypothetical protein [Thalassoglobus neptunius]TWT57285.1 hypothetical protein KOR42_06440 [Thalassoglobus neptunius]